jgi:ABC-2 type transport system permease protein
MLNKYLATAQSYTVLDLPADELAEKINKVLDNEIEVETLSKIDTTQFAKPTRYFNFANYAILACVITIICLIMGSFNRREIRRRNLVSAVEISKMNGALLRNSCLYSFGVWLLYVVIGYFLVGSKELLNLRGVLYLANSLAFCICATTIAYLISRLISGRNATDAVMNIVALGSSFLCGCFVPAEYLPDFVLTFAHILPSYYYVAANDKIGTLQGLEFSDIRPVLINIVIILGFSVAFVIAANIISKAKQRE